MIELSVSLASNGVVKVPGYEQLVRFGYTKNRGVYRLAITATGEWEGLTIRAFWHVPDGKDPLSSLVVDGYVDVPASVTAQPGNGCITFEGSDGTKTVTSADLRYRVAANSGTEDGTEPEPGTPAWQQLVDAVHTDAAAAEQAKNDAQTAAQQASTSAGNADESAQKAANSLQELKDGIASGNFKGEPGTSPTVTVQDIAGGHRIVITDATGTSFVDVLNGKQGDPGKPGDTGATPELTIGTVEEGDAPSATITGTAKNPVLNLTLKSGAPGKDSTVDATLSQSGQAADAKVTGDELATKAVIDDTAVGTDAWSSKHIVDMLCPPLEETGNPVQCYPVSGYPLGCKVSWEPTQEGSGDPSPDNVRPIKGRDSVTVERCGWNLLNITPFTKLTNKGITYEYVANGGVHISGIATAAVGSPTFAVGRLPPGKYYGLAMGTGVSASIVVHRNGVDLWLNAKGAFKILAGDVIKYWYMIAANGATIDTTIYPCIVPGTTAPTTYAPYTGQTATLTLPRTIYGGTVDTVSGEGQDTWKMLTLDGTEKWQDNGNVASKKEQQWALYGALKPYSGTFGISSHFDNTKGSMVYPFNFVRISDNSIVFHVALDGPFATINALKSYLAAQYAAGTPVQICYKLTEPVPFTATGAQPIPALSGVNTVLTDADSATVTGRADPIKRITDLEDAVASMTTT
jgi:hypothetical protein